MSKRLVLILFLVLFNFPANAITILREAELEEMIRDIAKPVLQVAGLNPGNINVVIYHTPEMNAFVTEDNNIYVSTGLIAYSDEPDTVAGVLAHETGHIVSGHIAARKEEIRRLEKEMLFSYIASAVVGIGTKSSEAGVGSLSAMQNYYIGKLMKYSRTQEEAADSEGLNYLARLGVSNQGLMNFLTELLKNEKINSNQQNAYLRTHPVTRERVDKIKKFNIAHPNIDTSIFTMKARDRFKLASFKARALIDNPDNVMLRVSSNEGNKYYSYALAIAAYRKGDLKLASDRVNYLLSSFPSNPYYNELLAQIYMSAKDINKSITAFETAYRLKPTSTILRYEYANALVTANVDLNHAIKLLESVVAEERESSTAYATLGKAYALNKDNSNGYLAIALSAVFRGDLSAAKRFRGLASSMGIKPEGEGALSIRMNELDNAIEEAEKYQAEYD